MNSLSIKRNKLNYAQLLCTFTQAGHTSPQIVFAHVKTQVITRVEILLKLSLSYVTSRRSRSCFNSKIFWKNSKFAKVWFTLAT